MKRLLLALTVSAALASPTQATDLEDGVNRKAVNGYHALAEQGDGSAMFSLYSAYLEGNGVPQDRETAYMWLTLAERAGDKTAKFFLKFDPLHSSKFTAEQIDRGRNRANEWLKQHE